MDELVNELLTKVEILETEKRTNEEALQHASQQNIKNEAKVA